MFPQSVFRSCVSPCTTSSLTSYFKNILIQSSHCFPIFFNLCRKHWKLASFWWLYANFEHISHLCSSASIVNFEQVNASCVYCHLHNSHSLGISLHLLSSVTTNIFWGLLKILFILLQFPHSPVEKVQYSFQV